jgi:hypothetical protein
MFTFMIFGLTGSAFNPTEELSNLDIALLVLRIAGLLLLILIGVISFTTTPKMAFFIGAIALILNIFIFSAYNLILGNKDNFSQLIMVIFYIFFVDIMLLSSCYPYFRNYQISKGIDKINEMFLEPLS